jgi:NAD(P)-dependent dehydrogenase (short-subunit alcohol dehydrogenase family)
MGLLDGKVAVVTGGSRGIGRATAGLFAGEGANIAICGRTENTLRDAAQSLSDSHGTRVIWQCADILDTASVERFMAAVGDAFGHVDILINNAGESSQREVNGVNWPVNAVDAVGQALPAGRFESITDDEWRNALEQKLLGMIRVTRCALPLMRRAGSGSIVNVTSIKGRQPAAARGNFRRCMGRCDESLKGIVARACERQHPRECGERRRYHDRTDGSGTRKMGAGQIARGILQPRVANIPLQRLGTVEEVAQGIYYLASPLSSYVTGQCLAIDGGGLRTI